MTQTTGSKLSSKLTASVRQAKEQTAEKETAETKPTPKTKPTVEVPLAAMPSKRIWPD